MDKTLIRLVCVFLLAAMMVSFVACANTPVDPETTTDPAGEVASTTAAPVDTTPETTALNAMNILGPKDFGKETLTFFSRMYNGVWSSDLMSEGQDGRYVNDAVYKRNSKISEQYNVNIEEIESGNVTFRDDVGNRIASGDTSYQVLYMGLADAANAALSGYLLDMTEMSNINLEGEWWTQSSNDAWSIGGSQYFATGDITTIDDQAIRTMFFNKDIIKEHNLKTIYELVYDNEWTYEKFFEYAEIAKRDNGDGVTDLNDTFGATAQVTFGFMMTMASGEMLVKKNNEDIPELAVANDSTRFVDVVGYLTERIADNDGIYLGADQDIQNLFGNGQALFLAEVLLHAETFRMNFDINFGIVPMPKYNSEQEEYHQYTTGYCTTVICFPTSTMDSALDMSTFLVEAMAIESVETVTPAYYDVCLKGRYADDVESMSMLDIVTTNVSSDYAEILGWGGFKTAVQDAISAGVPISGIIKANSPMTKKAIQRAMQSLEDLKK